MPAHATHLDPPEISTPAGRVPGRVAPSEEAAEQDIRDRHVSVRAVRDAGVEERKGRVCVEREEAVGERRRRERDELVDGCPAKKEVVSVREGLMSRDSNGTHPPRANLNEPRERLVP